MVLAQGSPASQPCVQGRAGQGGERDKHPTPPGMEVMAEPEPPRDKGWGIPEPQVELDASSAPFHGCRVAVSHLSPVCLAVFRVPQESGCLLWNVSPSRSESCPTYLGLRLPSQGTQGRVSQAVQRQRAKWARLELLKPSLELPAGCCTPPVAGSVPWLGLAGRGAAGSLFAFAS